MNLLLATAEFFPSPDSHATAGTVHHLAAELVARGHSVACAIPATRAVLNSGLEFKDTGLGLSIPMAGRASNGRLFEARTELGVKIFAVRRDEYYDRTGLFQGDLGDYEDNAERFIFFNKFILEIARRMQPEPQVIHCNDWFTAMVPAFVRAANLPYKTVLTVHRTDYQGSFWELDFDLTNLSRDYFTPGTLEFYGRMNFLKGGLLLANRVVLASEGVARGCMAEPGGCGLEGVFREQAGKMTCIPDAPEGGAWDPSADSALEEGYSAGDLTGKKKCRKALADGTGWKKLGADLLAGVVPGACNSQLADAVRDGWESLSKLPVRWVVWGGGSGPQLGFFQKLAMEHPTKVTVTCSGEKDLRQALAACDLWVSPSLSVPTGGLHRIAHHYGTVPLLEQGGELPSGFKPLGTKSGHVVVADNYSVSGLLAGLEKAVDILGDAKARDVIAQRLMKISTSWGDCASAHEGLYPHA